MLEADESESPPMTAIASGCCISEPAPIASARGVSPTSVARVVIAIGRMRRSAA